MKSIKILIAIAAISVVGIQQSHGQEDELPSAESIMNKFVEATGGIDKYKAVKSMVGEGTLSIPAAGLNGTLKLAMETSGKLKVEAEIPGATTCK